MSDASSHTVLIVDDSIEDRTIIRRMLRETGHPFTLLECETGEEGLREARVSRPDCILLDYRLPDMNAVEFLDALSGERRGSLPFPVAVLTGFDDTDGASATLGRGAQDYVVKGTLSAHGLQRVIENSIEKFSIVRELNDKRAILELRNRQLETVREQLEANLAELVDATRAKDRFMAVMSHEMRTPLNAVLGYVDLLELGIAGELTPAQRDYVERIGVGSRHLLDLINDVLDLARADARKLELDLRPVDVLAVVEEVVALLQGQAESRGIRLSLELSGDPIPLAQADLQRTRQIVTNLIGNALKFTDEGSVTVRVGASDGYVGVQVEDTGIGISAEVLPLIFNDFYQADGDLTRKRGGSGLGLAISKKLALLMHGSLEAESELGKGSTFVLRLPFALEGSLARLEDALEHEARMQAHRAAREEKKPPQPGAVVVAYSDNAEGLAELKERVHPSVQLRWTTEVNEVPQRAREEGASLVVLDIGCSGGAGWEAAHALRDDRELASVAVLLLPCIPMPVAEDPPGGLDLGWITLVPKPFTYEQLTQAVYTAAHGGGAGEHGSERSPVDVLVVDDDADSRRVASAFLSSPRVHVREVADGETALATMRRRPPDVVVLDLMMPVLDGFGVLAAMRADPLLTQIPVVVLSAKSLSEAERQFLARTAVRVLQKGEHRLSDIAALVLRAAAGAHARAEQERNGGERPSP